MLSGKIMRKNRALSLVFVSCFTSTAVPAPSDLSFDGVTADSMRVTWKPPQVPKSSDIERYIIHYHPVNDDDDTVEQIAMGNADFIILYSTCQQNLPIVVCPIPSVHY